MIEEEKKAIENLTEIKELVEEDLKYKDYNATAILDQTDLEGLVVTLNLIDKQQKEIEELKEKNKHITKETVEFVNSHYIHKDIIREKIKELNKRASNYELNYSEYYYKMEILKELLGRNKTENENRQK